jgi:hypothetical protein
MTSAQQLLVGRSERHATEVHLIDFDAFEMNQTLQCHPEYQTNKERIITTESTSKQNLVHQRVLEEEHKLQRQHERV